MDEESIGLKKYQSLIKQKKPDVLGNKHDYELLKLFTNGYLNC